MLISHISNANFLFLHLKFHKNWHIDRLHIDGLHIDGLLIFFNILTNKRPTV